MDWVKWIKGNLRAISLYPCWIN